MNLKFNINKLTKPCSFALLTVLPVIYFLDFLDITAKFVDLHVAVKHRENHKIAMEDHIADPGLPPSHIIFLIDEVLLAIRRPSV